METGGAVTGQDIGSGFQNSVNPDGFVTIDVESFSHVLHKDFSSSPRITLQRSVSRKGSPRSNNERKLHCDANGNDKETSFPQSPLRGSSTPEKPNNNVGPTDHAGTTTTTTTTTTAVSASPLHQITVTTAAGNMISSDQNRERRFGFPRKSSFKRSNTSWLLDPKKIVLFFATLSSMGSILLIIFTLSIGKSSPGDMSLD